MAKKKLKTSLKTRNKTINCEVLGLVNNKHFSYLENEFTVVLDIQDDCVKMIRKNNEYKLEFLFKNDNTSKCLIDINNNMTSIVKKLKKLEIKEGMITISYQIEKEEFQYSVQY